MAEPGLVAGHLPQIRWLILHALGRCAGLDPGTAPEALPRAEAFAEGNNGACLWGATVLYWVYAGPTPEANVRAVYPNLKSAAQAPETDKRGLERNLWMHDQSEPRIWAAMAIHAEAHVEHEKVAVRRVARRIQRRLAKRQEPEGSAALAAKRRA